MTIDPRATAILVSGRRDQRARVWITVKVVDGADTSDYWTQVPPERAIPGIGFRVYSADEPA